MENQNSPASGSASAKPQSRVFISHAFDDHAIAELVSNAIEARGVPCWIAPRDIMPGEDYPAAIQRGIAECHTMVLIFTANASASKFVKREVTLAVEHNAVIVPFRTEDVRPEKDLEFNLAGVHWLDAVAPPLEQHIRTLAERVVGIVNGSTAQSGAEDAAAQLQKRRAQAARVHTAQLWKRGAAVLVLLVLLAAGGLYLAQRPHRPTDSVLRAGLEHKLEAALAPLGVRIECDSCGDRNAHVNVRVEDGNATLSGALSTTQQQVLHAMPLQSDGLGTVSYSIAPLNEAQPSPQSTTPAGSKPPVTTVGAAAANRHGGTDATGNTVHKVPAPQPAAEDDDASRVRKLIANGRAHLSAGNAVSAANYFNAALDLEPDNAAAKAGLQAAERARR